MTRFSASLALFFVRPGLQTILVAAMAFSAGSVAWGGLNPASKVQALPNSFACLTLYRAHHGLRAQNEKTLYFFNELIQHMEHWLEKNNLEFEKDLVNLHYGRNWSSIEEAPKTIEIESLLLKRLRDIRFDLHKQRPEDRIFTSVVRGKDQIKEAARSASQAEQALREKVLQELKEFYPAIDGRGDQEKHLKSKGSILIEALRMAIEIGSLEPLIQTIRRGEGSNQWKYRKPNWPKHFDEIHSAVSDPVPDPNIFYAATATDLRQLTLTDEAIHQAINEQELNIEMQEGVARLQFLYSLGLSEYQTELKRLQLLEILDESPLLPKAAAGRFREGMGLMDSYFYYDSENVPVWIVAFRHLGPSYIERPRPPKGQNKREKEAEKQREWRPELAPIPVRGR